MHGLRYKRFLWTGGFLPDSRLNFTANQEAQLSPRGCAMLRVIEYLLSHSRSLKVIESGTSR